jgi:phospholipid/cholesterol/gamma-HCH transport system substrate-binding protein
MNESSNKRIIVVGLFIFFGLLFLLAGILTIGNLRDTFTKKMKLTAFFDDVNGLQSGSNIWFSGVKVGTVKKVLFYGESKVEVILNLDENVQQYIRKDAKVKISTDGLIGNKILVIYGGSRKAGPVEDKDTLGVEQLLSTEDIMKTLQQNNKNILVITENFKTVSKKIADGQGSIGKLLHDETLYDNILSTTVSLQKASAKAQQMMGTVSQFTSHLNQKGTLANDIVTDTVVFKSMRTTIINLQKVSDTASILVTNLKEASSNPNSPVGVLLHDKKAGGELKDAIKHLDSSSVKLYEDLAALQHNFLLRKYFKKKAKKAKEKMQ